MKFSNSQDVAVGGGCSTQGNGACIDPADTRDSLFPGIFKLMTPIQVRS